MILEINFDKSYLRRCEIALPYCILVLVSLYALNAIGNMQELKWVFGGRRYLNALWFCLGAYLIVSKGRFNKSFFLKNAKPLVPVFLVCLLLYFYHSRAFDLAYFKYAFLLILACSVVSNIKWFGIKEFFLVNSLSCLFIFFAAFCQISFLGYEIPNGDINQNIFASLALITGNISVFSVLYKTLNRTEHILFSFCGVLAIWVALRTTCRTAYITELVLTCLFLFFAYKKLYWSWKKIVAVFLLILASMLVVILESPDVTKIKFGVIPSEISDFFALEEKETVASSIGLRLAMWKAAITDIIPNHLLFGIGDLRQINRLDLLPNSSIDREFLSQMLHFHNEGISALVMGGIFLFVVCNWLLLQLFKTAKNSPVLLCLLVGTIVWGMTEVALLHKNFFFLFVSIWLLYSCASQQEQTETSKQQTNLRDVLLTRTKMPKFESKALCRCLLILFVLVKLPIVKALAKKNKTLRNKKSILVLCNAHMGDVLCMVPALHLLRGLNPNSELSILVSPALCSFFRRSSANLKPIPFDERDIIGNLKLFLRFHFYDEAYVLWNKRDLLLGRALGAIHITANEKIRQEYFSFLADAFYKAETQLNYEHDFESFVLAIYGKKAKSAINSLRYNRNDYFPEVQNAKREKIVVLHPCCQSPNRMCPPIFWEKIAAYVKKMGFKVLFTGNGEKERSFVEQCDPHHIFTHAVGTYSIDELALKFCRSSLLITVDTGVLHLAKFTGIKILVLCGGSEPKCIRPSKFFDRTISQDSSTIISHSPFYAVCSNFKCEAKHPHCWEAPAACYHWDGKFPECMKSLKIGAILRKTKSLLVE